MKRLGRAAALAAMLGVTACTSGDVMDVRPAVDVGLRTSALQPRETPASPEEPAGFPEDTAMQPLSAEEETYASMPTESAPVTRPAGRVELAGYPRMDTPALRPTQLSADELECRASLKKMNVAFTEVAPIREGTSCGIAHPIRVTRIGRVAMKPAATLNCAMAEAFASWTRNELVPASRWRFMSGVKAVHQGSSYSCRNIAGTGTPSEHTRGNAIDIMKIELNNGKIIDVRKPGIFAFRKRGLLNTVRADGCEYFTTVLGPGYNADHADHFHFDIKARRNGHRACR